MARRAKTTEDEYIIQSTLTPELKAFARELGDGSEAEGVRVALRQALTTRWTLTVVSPGDVPAELLPNGELDRVAAVCRLEKQKMAGETPAIPGIMVSLVA